MSNLPPVSVIMPVYNAGKYLSLAVHSILKQRNVELELCVVDDGSTDNSLKILHELQAKDNRIRIFSRKNTGIVGALNDAIGMANHELLARMDADDIALPDRLWRQALYMRDNPDVVALGTSINFMDSHGDLIKWAPRETDPAKIEQAILQGDGGALIHPTVMMRKSAVEKVGRYHVEAQWVEDLDLYLRLSQLGKLTNLPDVLFYYRSHTQSVNATRNEGRRARWRWALEEAHKARGLTFVEPTSAGFETQFDANQACDYAISALRFPGLSAPWRYTLRALRMAPTSKRSWKTFSYITKATFGLVPRT